MASDMVKCHRLQEETHCCHFIGYSLQLAARDLLYAPCHRKNNTCHELCYTSCEALDGKKNSLMGPPGGVDPVITDTGNFRNPSPQKINKIIIKFLNKGQTNNQLRKF